jgi:hypothetical protein
MHGFKIGTAKPFTPFESAIRAVRRPLLKPHVEDTLTNL